MRDSVVVKLLEQLVTLQTQSSQSSDNSSITNVIIVIAVVVLLPLLWYLIRKWFKDNDLRFDELRVLHSEALKSVGDGISKLSDTVQKVAADLSEQATSQAIQRKDIDTLLTNQYEHQRNILDITKRLHQIEVRQSNFKIKLESVNSLSLGIQEDYIKEVERLDRLHSTLNEVLNEEIRRHDRCTSFNPRHS